MRTSTIAFALLLTTAAAIAQEQQTPESRPDYSRDTLMRVFTVDAEEAARKPRVQFRDGAVEFTALGLDWRFPTVVAPLIGSVRDDVSMAWPDAFSTLGVPLATGPRAARRMINAERRRIERLERERGRTTVVVRP